MVNMRLRLDVKLLQLQERKAGVRNIKQHMIQVIPAVNGHASYAVSLLQTASLAKNGFSAKNVTNGRTKRALMVLRILLVRTVTLTKPSLSVIGPTGLSHKCPVYTWQLYR